MIRFLVKTILNIVPRPLLIRLSLFFLPLIKRIFRGHRFKDPIDGKTYSYFFHYGYKKTRKNALSPGTLSLERHRLIWLYLEKETPFFTRPIKLLHVAPEQIFYKKFKSLNNIDYTSVDLDSPLATHKADLTDLPFEDNSFDVILCNHVLEHIENDTKAMTEMFRVLKTNGWGIFQVPIYDIEHTYEDATITSKKDRKDKFGQYDHVRKYGKDYPKRLSQSGFNVDILDYSKKLDYSDVQKYALDPHEKLYIGKKPSPIPKKNKQ